MTLRYPSFVLLLALLIPYQLSAVSTPHLVIRTEEDPPLTFRQDGKVTGLVGDVVQEIQRRLGNQDTIEVKPWARSYRETQSGANNVLFSTTRTRAREHLFKWVGPVVEVQGGLFVLRSNTLALQSLADAKKLKRIIVVRDWYLQQILTEHGFSNLTLVTNPTQMLDMLMRNRADAIVSENVSLPYQLRQLGYDPAQVKMAMVIAQNYGYIAFSPQTQDAIVRNWQEALDEMKLDGSFAAIYQHWLPNESPPASGIHSP